MRLLEVIGLGGSSEVRKILLDGEVYAAKIVSTSVASREMQVFSRVLHPNLLAVSRQAIKLSNGKVAIIEPLAISDAKRYCGPRVLKLWLWQLVSALKAMHSIGFVHGDIKASNVLVFAPDMVRLADFGMSVACSSAEGVEDKTGVSYTITHRPIEVVAKSRWSYPADIWALGCTFFELACGKLIFRPSNAEECMNAFAEWADKPVVESGDELLNDLILSMLQLSPNQRANLDDISAHSYFDSVR